MTTITLPRAVVEQALEAMRCAVPTGKITLYEWDKAVSDLNAALAQQRLTDAQQEMERSIESLKAALAQQAEPVEPVAWRYWKQKWNCWEYSDTKLEFPAVPAGTKMEPLYLVSREVKSERPPVGTVHKSVKGGVVWNRWPDEMDDGTKLHASPAQQAKIDEIAVEQWKLRMVFYDENGEPSMSRQPEPDEMRAALAQQAEPTWVCPDSPEHRYAKPGHCEDCGKTLVQEQANPPGCDHCNHPLYAATKCRVCGRVTEQAEPVEPVAEFDHGIGADRFKVVRGSYWWHILIGDSPIKRGKFHTQAGAEEMAALLLREFRNGAFVQHYTAPPQRKPLTDQEIDRVWDQWFGAYGLRGSGGPYTRRGFARAIERAHGIPKP